MSCIIPERFTSDKQPRKIRVERMIADHIMFSLPNQRRCGRGIPIVSLVGPDVDRHFQTYKELLGEGSNLYVAERDSNIHLLQKQKAKSVKKIKLYNTDFFVVASEVVNRTNARTIFFDYDACRTYTTQVREEYLLCKMQYLAEDIRAKPFPALQNIWMTCTFACRGEKISGEEIAEQIADVWRNKGFSVEVVGLYSYRDGATMREILFHITS